MLLLNKSGIADDDTIMLGPWFLLMMLCLNSPFAEPLMLIPNSLFLQMLFSSTSNCAEPETEIPETFSWMWLPRKVAAACPVALTATWHWCLPSQYLSLVCNRLLLIFSGNCGEHLTKLLYIAEKRSLCWPFLSSAIYNLLTLNWTDHENCLHTLIAYEHRHINTKI